MITAIFLPPSSQFKQGRITIKHIVDPRGTEEPPFKADDEAVATGGYDSAMYHDTWTTFLPSMDSKTDFFGENY